MDRSHWRRFCSTSLSAFSAFFCFSLGCFDGLLSRNLGSSSAFPSLLRGSQFSFQSRYTSASRGQGSYNTIKGARRHSIARGRQKKYTRERKNSQIMVNIPWEVSAVSWILTHSLPRERNFCINICRMKQYEKEIKKQKESNTWSKTHIVRW
jgi:hypothetical protein